MLYRELGKTGEKVSILGFGAMRLPIVDGDYAKIDEEKAIEMVRYSIDQGVDYLDTAYPYHGGMSEAFCAKVMEEGYREKVKIATKLPVWDVKEHADMEKFLDEQRDNLKVAAVDFYLLHALCQSNWRVMKENDYKSFLDKAKADGKIKYAGFSYHDDLDLFKEIIDDYDWDICQIQLNYMDDHYQAGIEGMRYAHDKGIGVIVMEPLRGGMLSRTALPEQVEAIWNSADVKRTPAEWALRYVWNYEEVGVVLSGMSTLDHVKENIRTASEAYPNSLTHQEKDLISEVREFFINKTEVNCTNCQYCMPCPAGVNIPENFWAYNHDSQFNDTDKAKYWITGWLKEHARASKCVDCGKCETHCPQSIEIRKHLKMIAEKYEAEAV